MLSIVSKVHSDDRTGNSGFKLDKFRFSNDIGKNWFGNRAADGWKGLLIVQISVQIINRLHLKID